MFVMGASIDAKSTVEVIESAKKVLGSLTQSPPSEAEVAQARNELLTQFSNAIGKTETMVDFWLDGDTFKLPPISERLKTLNALSAGDVQRVANRLFQNVPIASIALGDAQQLKAQTEGRLPTEVMGELPKSKSNQSETRTAPKPNTVDKP
jgi:predicted Zn-dependent peptidase